MDRLKLLPCPFCGDDRVTQRPEDGTYDRVSCFNCGANICSHNAVYEWNRRQSLEAVRDEVLAALEEAARRYPDNAAVAFLFGAIGPLGIITAADLAAIKREPDARCHACHSDYPQGCPHKIETAPEGCAKFKREPNAAGRPPTLGGHSKYILPEFHPVARFDWGPNGMVSDPDGGWMWDGVDEPNAAPQAGQDVITAPSQEGHAAGPAPAAPDVAGILSDWRVVAEFFGSRNWPDTKLGDAASRLHARLPALLSRLGQGWIPGWDFVVESLKYERDRNHKAAEMFPQNAEEHREFDRAFLEVIEHIKWARDRGMSLPPPPERP